MISFSNFPRLKYEMECEGADITVDGKYAGVIQREVVWTDKWAALKGSKSEVLGYTVMLLIDKDDHTFDTLGQARDYVRRRMDGAPEPVRD